MIGLLAFDGQSKPDLCTVGVRLRRYGGFPRWILVDSLQHLMPAFDGGDDVFGIGLPDERRGALVVLLDEVVDGGLQGDHGMEDAALELSAAQLGEEALDRVEPSKARRPLIRYLEETRSADRGGKRRWG